ncbi:MAG: hypothetical protein ACRCYC_00175 [Paraclostridium sp.]|uniref:hypothetical protein n=1 Tax=Paraclostridium sp. TaxID=2023273 RepID=UPI003F3C7322
MKVLVKSKDIKRDINISLPMCMITTVLKFINVSSIKYGSDNKIVDDLFTDCNKANLIKGLKYLRKYHKGLVLVEVDSPNGEVVKIQI